VRKERKDSVNCTHQLIRRSRELVFEGLQGISEQYFRWPIIYRGIECCYTIPATGVSQHNIMAPRVYRSANCTVRRGVSLDKSSSLLY
jgi:hypothetical protein